MIYFMKLFQLDSCENDRVQRFQGFNSRYRSASILSMYLQDPDRIHKMSENKQLSLGGISVGATGKRV